MDPDANGAADVRLPIERLVALEVGMEALRSSILQELRLVSANMETLRATIAGADGQIRVTVDGLRGAIADLDRRVGSNSTAIGRLREHRASDAGARDLTRRQLAGAGLIVAAASFGATLLFNLLGRAV